MSKVYKKNNADDDKSYIDKNKEEMKCLFGLVYFSGFLPWYKTANKKTNVGYIFCKKNLQGCSIIKEIWVVYENSYV